MKITRHHHLRYLNRLTPILVALYVFQIYLYRKFAPTEASDMTLFLGIGLCLIIVAFHFFDYHHMVTLKENFLEVRFDVLKRKEEILYEKIVHMEVSGRREGFAHLVLYLQDGDTLKLPYIDSPEIVMAQIRKRSRKEIKF
jgi:hypothetical protein